MANQMNSRQSFLRLTGCCFALALACLFAQPAAAATIHSGTFTEDGPPEGSGDTFTITNDALSTEDILSVVIDLTLSPNSVYDIAGGGSSPFNSADPYQTDNVDGALKVLTITFAAGELTPGDTFTFTIDLDDSVSGATISGGDIAGSQVTATFALAGPIATGILDGGGINANWASPIPEPNTLALLGLGLTGLAWGGRRRR
ncbi:MAG: PEP-CTERM sorting domain-containing protein [Deltaproteobacteria bacterium]|nr:PEP-CTERM sorting domain-containing protein [Deltaproteobacteria bacterium]